MSARKTYDTEILTVRQVNALNSNDSFIASNRILTTDGRGGTYWAVPSSLGAFGAYNEIRIDNLPFVADLSYNRLYLSSGSGIGFSMNSTLKRAFVFSKGFTQFDVSGGNTLVGYSNGVVSPTLKVVGQGSVRVSGDPLTNTLFVSGTESLISTGIYGYSKVNVISNASTLTMDAIGNSNNAYLESTSPSTFLTVLGVNDILLTTNTTKNAYFMSISTFTSKGYLDISGVAYGSVSSSLSTVSTLFYDGPKTGNATSSLVSFTSNISVGIRQQFNYDQQNVMLNYTSLDRFKLFSSFTLTTMSNYARDQATINKGLISTVSFYSSIGTNNFQQTNYGLYDSNSLDTGVSYSSVSFRLDSLSSIVQKNAKVSIQVQPSFLFANNATPARIFYVSTMIQAGASINLSTLFVRPYMATQAVNSNVWADHLTIPLESAYLSSTYTSSYTFLHRFTTWNGGFTTSTVQHLTYGCNALHVRVNGTNFTGI